jgi:hypothetical protein
MGTTMARIVPGDDKRVGGEDPSKAGRGKVSITPQDANHSCAQIVDVVFDKLVELMDRDGRLDPLRREFVVTAAQKVRGPVKEYVLAMSAEDAKDIVERVRGIVEQ